jgi:hypothetical protein
MVEAKSAAKELEQGIDMLPIKKNMAVPSTENQKFKVKVAQQQTEDSFMEE